MATTVTSSFIDRHYRSFLTSLFLRAWGQDGMRIDYTIAGMDEDIADIEECDGVYEALVVGSDKNTCGLIFVDRYGQVGVFLRSCDFYIFLAKGYHFGNAKIAMKKVKYHGYRGRFPLMLRGKRTGGGEVTTGTTTKTSMVSSDSVAAIGHSKPMPDRGFRDNTANERGILLSDHFDGLMGNNDIMDGVAFENYMGNISDHFGDGPIEESTSVCGIIDAVENVGVDKHGDEVGL